MMKDLKMWLKASGLFLVRSFSNYVWIKLVFMIILFFDVKVIGAITVPHEMMNGICIGLGVFMAMNTIYVVDGQKVRLWSKEFGFNPERFKEEE